jgi:hypothetical protein|tara:strand:+ start:502 stop:942 length:441 start_codon:yes stop_codon:yes gene_type:complete
MALPVGAAIAQNPDASGVKLNIHPLDSAYTVLQSDSGKVFMISATGGDQAITLPVAADLQAGWNCKFVVLEDTPSNVTTLAAGSAIIDFVMKDPGANASNSTAGTAVSNIIIGETCTQGDVINLFTDGATYYAEGLSGIDDAFTTS